MYKELNNLLKEFKPTKEDLNVINNNYLNHTFIHSGDNLFGEQYEAWVYEYLKLWASRCPEVTKFILKEPNNNSKINSGLSYDKNGQIIYLKNGKKIAEFDGIFIYKERVVFVESSVSELRQYFKKIEEKLLTKRALLVDLFKREEVYYLMVTRPNKRTLVYRSLPHLILYKLKNPDFTELLTQNRASYADVKLEVNSKLVRLDSIF